MLWQGGSTGRSNAALKCHRFLHTTRRDYLDSCINTQRIPSFSPNALFPVFLSSDSFLFQGRTKDLMMTVIVVVSEIYTCQLNISSQNCRYHSSFFCEMATTARNSKNRYLFQKYRVLKIRENPYTIYTDCKITRTFIWKQSQL